MLFCISVAAPAAEVSCYTVQLAALPSEEQANAFLRDEQLSARCAVVAVPGLYTVRCDPERSYLLAMRKMGPYREAHPSAYVNVTPRHLVRALSSPPSQAQFTCFEDRDVFDTVLLPASFMAIDQKSDEDISSIVTRVEDVRDEYLDQLNDRGSFKGLYLRSQLDRDTNTDDEREQLFLEWELFDEGWYESKRELDEKRVETKLQYLQLLRDMRERNMHESLFRLQGVINAARFYQAKKILKALKNLLTKYEEQLKQGYATQDEFQDVRYKYESAQSDVHHYSGLDQRRMDARAFDIANTIEYVSLASVDSLTKQAIDNSYDLQIQELFINRSEFFPQWVDNLSLRLYAGAERDFGADQRDNIVGIRLRVPIDFKPGRANMIDIEQSAFRDQKQAISLRLAQKTSRLSELFQFHQKRVKTAASQYRLLQGHRNLKQEQSRYPLSALPAAPDKVIDSLSIELLAKEEDILLARLAAFEVLLQLDALVKPDSLSKLVAN